MWNNNCKKTIFFYYCLQIHNLATLLSGRPNRRVASCQIINKWHFFHNNYCFYFQNIWIQCQMWRIVITVKQIFALQDLRPFSILENLLPTLPTFCKYQINGCKTIQDLATIESSHEVDCDLRNVSCIYQNCVSKKKYQKHLNFEKFHINFDFLTFILIK